MKECLGGKLEGHYKLLRILLFHFLKLTMIIYYEHWKIFRKCMIELLQLNPDECRIQIQQRNSVNRKIH